MYFGNLFHRSSFAHLLGRRWYTMSGRSGLDVSNASINFNNAASPPDTSAPRHGTEKKRRKKAALRRRLKFPRLYRIRVNDTVVSDSADSGVASLAPCCGGGALTTEPDVLYIYTELWRITCRSNEYRRYDRICLLRA